MKIKCRVEKRKKLGKPDWFRITSKDVEEVRTATLEAKSSIDPEAKLGGPVRDYFKKPPKR